MSTVALIRGGADASEKKAERRYFNVPKGGAIMGAASAVSRNIAGMLSGERAGAGRLYRKLCAKINS